MYKRPAPPAKSIENLKPRDPKNGERRRAVVSCRLTEEVRDRLTANLKQRGLSLPDLLTAIANDEVDIVDKSDNSEAA
ncbi:hypothetical protein [Limnoraphis robusta]|uniref:Protein CopB n=1 Tax=Limnoraphis robusta CCNP1315 TaxID=3110306 RepID=A0ABU5U2Q1_9CYAN|nr:hypothetical protein [Limnoraphis robusta]MEA5521335.1 hypothetical protein [Limnoraphis robusta CCNP1315]MEA5548910.1 hypothetical protein [Limnoraphis robusta CCNP1324]